MRGRGSVGRECHTSGIDWICLTPVLSYVNIEVFGVASPPVTWTRRIHVNPWEIQHPGLQGYFSFSRRSVGALSAPCFRQPPTTGNPETNPLTPQYKPHCALADVTLDGTFAHTAVWVADNTHRNTAEEKRRTPWGRNINQRLQF